MIEKEGEYDEGLSTQKTFKLHVLSLVEAIKDMGNPFLDQSEELLTLDTGNVVDESVIETVLTIEELGKKSSKATTSLSLLTVLAPFMSQSKRMVSHSLNAQNPNQKQSKI